MTAQQKENEYMKNPVKKPSWWDEFVTFAVKGNAMALAVGTIIGAAFSTITKSLTDDVIMPIKGRDTQHLPDFPGVPLFL